MRKNKKNPGTLFFLNNFPKKPGKSRYSQKKTLVTGLHVLTGFDRETTRPGIMGIYLNKRRRAGGFFCAKSDRAGLDMRTPGTRAAGSAAGS